jgi:hypothetical protein
MTLGLNRLITTASSRALHILRRSGTTVEKIFRAVCRENDERV